MVIVSYPSKIYHHLWKWLKLHLSNNTYHMLWEYSYSYRYMMWASSTCWGVLITHRKICIQINATVQRYAWLIISHHHTCSLATTVSISYTNLVELIEPRMLCVLNQYTYLYGYIQRYVYTVDYRDLIYPTFTCTYKYSLCNKVRLIYVSIEFH